MVGLFLAQVLMSFNVAALPISLGGMVEEFGVPPTTASSTIVAYGLAVAALVMTGAKLGQRVGWVLIFRIVVVVFAGSSLMMILSPTVGWAIGGQVLAGAAAAIIVPALVALIAENYTGDQQATAVGSLGSARAFSGVSAFLIGGTLGTFVCWRPVFIVTLVLAAAVFFLSFGLRSDRGNRAIRIDLVASLLIGAAIVMLTIGFNNLNGWGVLFASDGAPFSILGISPALVLVVLGIVCGQAFFLWTARRMRIGKVPLVDLSVLRHPTERAAVYAMFIIVTMEAAVNFTVPTYIQVVQGRTPFDTSLAMMPFNLTVFVTAAPKQLAGDVGSIRGTTQNLASAVGTAVMGAVVVTVLTFGVAHAVEEHPELPPELVSQVDLDSVNFVSNDELTSVLAGTTATPEQVEAAVELNEEQRLRTLKIGFLILAGVSAIAAIPASRLPRYRPDEIPESVATGD